MADSHTWERGSGWIQERGQVAGVTLIRAGPPTGGFSAASGAPWPSRQSRQRRWPWLWRAVPFRFLSIPKYLSQIKSNQIRHVSLRLAKLGLQPWRFRGNRVCTSHVPRGERSVKRSALRAGPSGARGHAAVLCRYLCCRARCRVHAAKDSVQR